MKKVFFMAALAIGFVAYSCNNSSKEGTHKHEDGSTHGDHDTTKPAQQEFNVTDTSGKKDTATHTHEDGTKHTSH